VERWEGLKAREKSSRGEQRTALGGVPKVLPALLRTHEIGIRAAAVGFDWERAADVVARSKRKSRSFAMGRPKRGRGRRARRRGDGRPVVRHRQPLEETRIEPESALRKANEKFTRRFSAMEARLRVAGRPLSECSLQELEDEWGRVKLAERQPATGAGGGSAAVP